MTNIFDRDEVDVHVILDGQKVKVGKAKLTQGAEGFVHVDMDLKADEQADVVKMLSGGITGYSVADEDVELFKHPQHRLSTSEIQSSLGLEPHEHEPRQHRDGRPPWCKSCGLTADYKKPTKNFNFGRPANPLRGNSYE